MRDFSSTTDRKTPILNSLPREVTPNPQMQYLTLLVANMRATVAVVLCIGSIVMFWGCSAPVRLTGYPGPNVGSQSHEYCRITGFKKVQVIGLLPPEGTYEELGYMTIGQSSTSELVYTSIEKQIEAARIKACQWGADAIVVIESQGDKKNTWGLWSGLTYRDERESRIVAIRYRSALPKTDYSNPQQEDVQGPQSRTPVPAVRPGSDPAEILERADSAFPAGRWAESPEAGPAQPSTQEEVEQVDESAETVPDPSDVRDLPERPADPTELFTSAEAAFETAHWSDALKLYEQLSIVDPDNPIIDMRRGECLHRIDEEKALGGYQRWLDEMTERREYHMMTATELMEAGDYENAAVYALRALAADPTWTDGRERLQAILEHCPDWRDCCAADDIFRTAPGGPQERERIVVDAMQLCEELMSATLFIEVSVPGARIDIDGERKGVSPLLPLNIPAGVHSIAATKTAFHDQERIIEIAAGDTIHVNLDLEPATGSAKIVSIPEGATLFLDDNFAGTTPLRYMALPTGTKHALLRMDRHESWEGTIKIIGGQEVSLRIPLREKKTTEALWRSALLPGLGQTYMDRGKTGALFTIIQVAAIGATVGAQVSYERAWDDYQTAKHEYEDAITDHDRLWQRAEDADEKANDKRKLRNIGISVAAGVYVVNLIDVLIN